MINQFESGKTNGADGPAGGKVWLVGAGPGDPGLFTLKGKQVLSRAEVVVYDALAGPEILRMIPKNAERIYVGKRSGRHTMKQAEINALLVRKAREGKRVIRLKGGDPFLFGRGGEELELLRKNEIPYEIVPGIPSAVAVPAYQGIPVTHRDFCSSVHIITGHRRADASGGMDFEALVRLDGTLVFLMGVAALGDICRGLLAAGMHPEMPAALLMCGTTVRQERVVATVATLEREVAKAGAKTPAVIVVGKVCALAERFSWYDKLLLGGVRVFLTRPEGLAKKTADRLRALGAEVLECPAIRTVRRENNGVLKKALDRIGEYQWLVFTSPTGVRVFFREMAMHNVDLRKLGTVKIACIGTGSAAELKKRGIYPEVMPEIFDGAHLGEALFLASAPGDRILIPRAAAGNRELVDALFGRSVDDIPIYDTVYEKNLFADWRDGPEFDKNDYVFFTSASTVRGFAAAILQTRGMAGGSEDTGNAPPDLSGINAICIGARTAREAENYGMRTWTAEQAGMDSMIECLLEAAKNRDGKECGGWKWI